MTQSRKWSLVAMVAVLAILAAGWFLLIAPKRADAADLKAQDVKAQSANEQLRTKLKELQALAPELPKREAEFAAIRRQIPDNPALPDLVRQLTSAATQSGADLASLAPATPVAVVAPVAAVPATPAPTDQLMQVPLSLTVNGSYSELEDYLSRLERLHRVMMVTGFTLGADANADASTGGVTLTLTGRVYMVHTTTVAAVTTPSATVASGTTTTGTPATAGVPAN